MPYQTKYHTAVSITAVCVILLQLVGCTPVVVLPTQEGSLETAPIQEFPVQIIPLSGKAASTQSEFSGLAWYGDWLVMLPQYPSRFGSGSLFVLPKETLVQAMAGTSSPSLEPAAVPFDDGGLSSQVQGFEGFECIVFAGERVFLSIEAQPQNMLGYLVAGTVVTGGQAPFSVQLDPASLVEIKPQAPLDNYSDESCTVFDDKLVTLYEANGVQVNPSPVAHAFNLELELLGKLAFPNIEYRLTDASEVDSEGRFWAINTFFLGDVLKLQPAETNGKDALAQRYGEGPTHAQNIEVERLVQLQIDSDKIQVVDSHPLQLTLAGDAVSRNWEGIVRLDESGFVLVTDSFPETLLGLVRFPK